MAGPSKLSTPPPRRLGVAYMTPPSTGKRAMSDELQVSRKRFQAAFDEVASFGESDTDTEDNSENNWVNLSDWHSDSSSNCVTSAKSLDPLYLVTPKDHGSMQPADKPFDFMGLPLSIRQRIYNMVLVVPAIICVRQKHVAYSNAKSSLLYIKPEDRRLLPGIAYALAKFTVDGTKFRYSRFSSANISMLCVSRQIHSEAKSIMYSQNSFEIIAPFSEMSPAVDFKIPLFPRHYQKLVQRLVISVRGGYCMRWLLSSGHGHAEVKKAYPALQTLTVIFELESTNRGVGRRLTKEDNERWGLYVKRLHGVLNDELSVVKNIPIWINMRVLFDGERYVEALELQNNSMTDGPLLRTASANGKQDDGEQAARQALKLGLPQAFELFKKGGRCERSSAEVH
ncbi:unnamed protein product [Periconia digitata]|uniref:Uncharacterized protein n=1 Tax=Periconia digitata TaxID=1303443 RepID=A0A9W4XT05_9PLEO|nr:unnamed protein product [Periconia digitata]